jgi:hypothetical protein
LIKSLAKSTEKPSPTPVVSSIVITSLPEDISFCYLPHLIRSHIPLFKTINPQRDAPPRDPAAFCLLYLSVGFRAMSLASAFGMVSFWLLVVNTLVIILGIF